LYPNHFEDTKNILSKVLEHANKFSKSGKEASYLLAKEVHEIWKKLKDITPNHLLENLDKPTKVYYYRKAEDADDDYFVKFYTIFQFSQLIAAYFSAQYFNEGLIIYYG